MKHNSLYPSTRARPFGALVFLILAIFALGALMGSGRWTTPATTVAAPSAPRNLCPRAAALPGAPPIVIDEGGTGNQWADCPWKNGTGTFEDPFVIQYLDIDGSGSSYCISIYNSGDYYFRVQHCILHDATNVGLYLVSTANGTIRNNTCSGVSQNGIYLDSVSNITLTGNNCTGNYLGIYLTTASNNTLSGNNCTGNTQEGIHLTVASNNNILSGNNCTGNFEGIYLDSACNNNTFSKNDCSGNTQYGFLLDSVNNNTLSDNTCTGNQDGLYLASSNNNTLSGNNCSRNTVHGIYFGSASNNTVTGNLCSNNSEVGMYLNTGSENNTILGNTFRNNSIYGMYIAANNNTLTGNIFAGNDNGGIYFAGASGNTITGNTCLKNLVRGITIDAASQYNMVTGNWIKKNVPNTLEDAGVGNTVSGNFFIGYPEARFTASPTPLVAGQAVQFTDATINGSTPLAYHWNFGDGTGTSAAQNPTYQFAASGTYTVMLTVTDADGDVSVYPLSITVEKQTEQTGIAGYDVLLLLGLSGVTLMLAIRHRRTCLKS